MAVASRNGANGVKGASATTPLDLEVMGATGLKHFAGRIYEEWLPELQGDFALKVFREMIDNDPIIGATWFAIEMLARQTSWSNQPADESNAAGAIAEFFDGVLEDMSIPWPEVISEIFSMGPYGWALFEECYKIRSGDVVDPTRRSKFTDGKVGWRKLEIRSQDTRYRWEYDDQNAVQGMWQIAPPKYLPTLLPMGKCLLFRTKIRKGNPEGVSMLRNAYRPWYFKKRMENIEGIGVERDLAGLPIAMVPPEMLGPTPTPQQSALLTQITKIVTGIRRDEQEGVVWPLAYDEQGRELYKLLLLSTGGQRQFDTNAIIGRYEQRMAMTLMGDFILLGHQTVGSFALVDSRTELFAQAIGAMLDIIARVIVEVGYVRLMRLNGFPMPLMPTLRHGDVESVDLNELGNYIGKLAGAGVPLFPNDELERYLLEQAHLPVPESTSDYNVDEDAEKSGPTWMPEFVPTEEMAAQTNLKVTQPSALAVGPDGAPVPPVPAPGAPAPAGAAAPQDAAPAPASPFGPDPSGPKRAGLFKASDPNSPDPFAMDDAGQIATPAPQLLPITPSPDPTQLPVPPLAGQPVVAPPSPTAIPGTPATIAGQIAKNGQATIASDSLAAHQLAEAVIALLARRGINAQVEVVAHPTATAALRVFDPAWVPGGSQPLRRKGGPARRPF
jgi:hypothetical protein